jgi:hypothetical protein
MRKVDELRSLCNSVAIEATIEHPIVSKREEGTDHKPTIN